MPARPIDLPTLLKKLIASWENECVEFKRANDNLSTSEIGKYFSALSNEANLRNRPASWLIFGVDNKTRSIVGTSYREDSERLHSLKKQIADGTAPSTTFREIHELILPEGRVILFEIPPAPRGTPISWNGHCWARDHESLAALNQAKHDEIRSQTLDSDWSAVICEESTLDDLDPAAIEKARQSYTQKFSERIPPDVIAGWDDATFLDKAKVTMDGKITRAALLLLGRSESTRHFSPHVAEMTWKLVGEELAYEHFHPPFFLTSSLLYQRIRNIKLTLLRPGDLIPLEIPKYDQRIVLEALHNCIAHQDYTRCERILVTEHPAELVFQNAGSFFDGSPTDYLLSHKTPTRYRNRFLAEAMVNLRMIDIMGFGIREIMFRGQAKRFLPLPDFDVSDPEHVVLRLPGRFLDENYSRVLFAHPDLDFADIFALDQIQKGNTKLAAPAVQSLKRRGLIEGRKPNFRIAADLATDPETKATYLRHRAFDDDYYRKLILDYLKEFGEAKRADFEILLMDKLSDGLSEEQKRWKIANIIQTLRKMGKITADKNSRSAKWRLSHPNEG